jgi:hypothetical protein
MTLKPVMLNTTPLAREQSFAWPGTKGFFPTLKMTNEVS